MIRKTIDDVVSEVNDCVLDRFVDESDEDSEQAALESLQEVMDEHGPFTDDEKLYILNNMFLGRDEIDLVGRVFGVTPIVNITMVSVE